jgi:hypothetical protein
MKYPLLLSMVLFSQVASASMVGCSNPPGFSNSQLLNVSAAGQASKAEPVIACTIINPGVSNDHALAFFAESSDGDAVLELHYVGKPYPTRIADNHITEIPESQRQPLINLLRNPNKDTDAALIMNVDPAFYEGLPMAAVEYRFGVCAYGYPKEGRAYVQVSISTVRHGYCYRMPAVKYFEHE